MDRMRHLGERTCMASARKRSRNLLRLGDGAGQRCPALRELGAAAATRDQLRPRRHVQATGCNTAAQIDELSLALAQIRFNVFGFDLPRCFVA
jgi:hypothetical protein